MIKPIWFVAGLALVGIASFGAGLLVGSSDDGDDSPESVERPSQEASPTASAEPGSVRPEAVTIDMGPIYSSGQLGTAVITEKRRNESMQIALEIAGSSPGIDQPAELRWSQPNDRQCEFPLSGGVAYALQDIVDGLSVTEIDEALYTFGGNASYVVVVYESAEQTEVPVACGVIDRADFQ